MVVKGGESMSYSVVGFEAGTINTARLHIEIVKHGYAPQIPSMKVYTVRSDDFAVLSSRFGERFANFVLLNDAAVEVCRAVGFAFVSLGSIEEAEIRDPLPLLGA
jgi:hypothetical protein